MLTLGAEILTLLIEQKTVSRLWDELRRSRAGRPWLSPLSYDWFVLALDLLFVFGSIDLERGLLTRTQP